MRIRSVAACMFLVSLALAGERDSWDLHSSDVKQLFFAHDVPPLRSFHVILTVKPPQAERLGKFIEAHLEKTIQVTHKGKVILETQIHAVPFDTSQVWISFDTRLESVLFVADLLRENPEIDIVCPESN